MRVKSLFLFLLLTRQIFLADHVSGGVPDTAIGKVNFEASRHIGGEQCVILNRSSPGFEKELLSVPQHACVIVIDSWIIKSDFLLRPVEMVSPETDEWRVGWNRMNSQMTVSSHNWSIKVKTRGIRQILGAVSYHF
jgi:hypothetical protein